MESAENLSIFVALGGGLLSFLSPCVLPLLPSYLSFITGMSFDDLKGPLLRTHVRKSVVLNSLFFLSLVSPLYLLPWVLPSACWEGSLEGIKGLFRESRG